MGRDVAPAPRVLSRVQRPCRPPEQQVVTPSPAMHQPKAGSNSGSAKPSPGSGQKPPRSAQVGARLPMATFPSHQQQPGLHAPTPPRTPSYT